ncbi:MAG: hypothetical protein IT172_11180 [Acidobacteria bacterium]|nr:hypothetical protein [Acidobacteriota bacterium]
MGFLKRFIPFIITFTIGMAVSGLFMSAAPASSPNRWEGRSCRGHRMKDLRMENEQLRQENEALREQLNDPQFIAPVPPPPAMPHDPPAAPKMRMRGHTGN